MESSDLPKLSDFEKIPIRMENEDISKYVEQGWVYEPTSILSTYKENWNEWFSIREFVQNSLDETEKFSLVYDDSLKISYIVDNGKGIDIKDMFLGQQKGQDEKQIHCLRGVYGEGMKLALIPLLNNGNKVIIRSVDFDYHFSLITRTSKRGDWAHIGILKQANNLTKGTVVAIQNVNCLKYADFFAPVIAEKFPEKIILTVKDGPEEYDDCKVRQVFDLPGKIFVRDIFVQEIDAIFGYNFWFDNTKAVLGSDRQQLKNPYMASKELNYLLEADSVYPEMLFKKLYNNTSFLNGPDKKSFSRERSLEWMCLERRDIVTNKTTANKIFLIIFGMVGGDYSWSKNASEQKVLEHSGIIDLRDRLPDLSGILIEYGLIKDPKDLRRAAELTTETVIITPEDFEIGKIHEDVVEEFKKLISQINCILKGVNQTDGQITIHFYSGNFKNEERVSGFYRRSTNQIFIKIDNIFDFDDLIKVFIHEAAHAICYNNKYADWSYKDEKCGDITQEFEYCLENVAASIIRLQRKGLCDFDELYSSTTHLNSYRDEIEALIQHKLLIVNNPKGLERPEHFDASDKEHLDKSFTIIAAGCYVSPYDIRHVLWGYNPARHRYSVRNHYGARGQFKNMSTIKIIEADQSILNKLNLEIPETLKLENFKNSTDVDSLLIRWEEFIEGASISRDIDLMKGEDFLNPLICIKFINEHPYPRVKERNFRNLLRWFAKDEKIIEAIHNMSEDILNFGKDLYSCLKYDPYWYLKEAVIKTAEKYEWLDVLKLYETAWDPVNRKYVVYAYQDLGRGLRDAVLSKLMRMFAQEQNPEVILQIITSIGELHALRTGKEETRQIILSKLIIENKDKLRDIANASDTDSAYRKQLVDLLESV